MNILMIPTKVETLLNPKGAAFVAFHGNAPNFEQKLDCFIPMKDIETAKKYIADNKIDNPQRLAEAGFSMNGSIVEDTTGAGRTIIRLMQVQRLEGAALASLRQQMRVKDMVMNVQKAYAAGDIDNMYHQVVNIANSIGLALKPPMPTLQKLSQDTPQKQNEIEKKAPSEPQPEANQSQGQPVTQEVQVQQRPVAPRNMRYPGMPRPVAKPSGDASTVSEQVSTVEKPSEIADKQIASYPKTAPRFNARRVNFSNVKLSSEAVARLSAESDNSDEAEPNYPAP